MVILEEGKRAGTEDNIGLGAAAAEEVAPAREVRWVMIDRGSGLRGELGGVW